MTYRIAKARRCPRCNGWLYVESDRERLDDQYIVCGLCGWERCTRYVHHYCVPVCDSDAFSPISFVDNSFTAAVKDKRRKKCRHL